MSTKLSGVMTALSTPFSQDGSIDETLLRALVDIQIREGVHGLVVSGSTGEFAAMSSAERKRIAEVVVEQVQGAVPVVVGTGSCATAEAVDLTAHAKSIGAAAALVVAPYYESPTREEIVEYYGAIGDIGLSMIAYNLPEVTGFNLDGEFYQDVRARTSSLAYAKDTSGNMELAVDLLQNYTDTVDVMIGLDTIVLPGFMMGSCGTIWGAPNFAPRECVRIWDAVQEGDYDSAREVFRKLWPVMDFICRNGYAASTKAAAALVGINAGKPRAPYGELSPQLTQELKSLLENAGISYE